MLTPATVQPVSGHTIKLKNGLTLQEDLFCVFFLEFGDDKQAYAQAFDIEVAKVLTSSCSALFEKPEIINRVEELYVQRVSLLAIDATVNVTRLTKMLEAARVGAMDAGQYGNAVNAVNAMAKLAGLIVDKSQITVKRVDEMTEEELRYIVNGSAKDVTPKYEGK